MDVDRIRSGCPLPTEQQLRERWAKWHVAMELSHAMLMAGLRQKIGPDADLQAAYREWYRTYQALKWQVETDTPEERPCAS